MKRKSRSHPAVTKTSNTAPPPTASQVRRACSSLSDMGPPPGLEPIGPRSLRTTVRRGQLPRRAPLLTVCCSACVGARARAGTRSRAWRLQSVRGSHDEREGRGDGERGPAGRPRVLHRVPATLVHRSADWVRPGTRRRAEEMPSVLKARGWRQRTCVDRGTATRRSEMCPTRLARGSARADLRCPRR